MLHLHDIPGSEWFIKKYNEGGDKIFKALPCSLCDGRSSNAKARKQSTNLVMQCKFQNQQKSENDDYYLKEILKKNNKLIVALIRGNAGPLMKDHSNKINYA